MTRIVYETQIGNDGLWYPAGPGQGYGYYSGHLFPETRFEEFDQCCNAVDRMNEAYTAGYEAALANVRSTLGIKDES